MKKLLFVVLSLICLQASALQGRPSNDRVVADLKNQFIEAKTPTADELVDNTSWNCREEHAYSSAVSSKDYVMNVFKYQNKIYFFGQKEFYYSSNELMSRWDYVDYSGVDYAFVRVNSKGDLLVEWAHKFPALWIFQDFAFDRSVVDPQIFAVSYAVCTQMN